MTQFKLRDYQERVINDTYSFFDSNINRLLLMMPTGSGKTAISTQLCIDAIRQRKRVLIIAHRTKLVNQIADMVGKFTGTTVGKIIAGKKPKYNAHWVFAGMIQTLRVRDLPDDIDMVIFDEAHESLFNKASERIMNKYFGDIWDLSKTQLIGLTATPWRTRKKEGFCRWFKAIVYSDSPGQMMSNGYLTKASLFSYDAGSMEGLKVGSDGDYTLKSMAKVCNEEYNQDIVNKYVSKFPKLKAIAFCGTVSQAEDLSSKFRAMGVTSDTVDGKMSESQRKVRYKTFKSGEIQVLVSVSTLTTGFDETSIDCVIIARPTRSVALLVQMMGRAMRLHPGKSTCYVLDFGECFESITKVGSHQIVDHADISYARLCPEYQKPANRKDTKDCPECDTPLPTFARICTHCNHQFIGKLKPKPKVVEFPELIPYMTLAGLKQYKWLRKQVCSRFENDLSPSTISIRFFNKYQRMPPQDFYLGALFSLDDNLVNYRAYRDYLFRHEISEKKAFKYFVQEFGDVGRTYTVDGNEYTCHDVLKQSRDALYG